jgi:hypothetical protein
MAIPPVPRRILQSGLRVACERASLRKDIRCRVKSYSQGTPEFVSRAARAGQYRNGTGSMKEPFSPSPVQYPVA